MAADTGEPDNLRSGDAEHWPRSVFVKIAL